MIHSLWRLLFFALLFIFSGRRHAVLVQAFNTLLTDHASNRFQQSTSGALPCSSDELLVLVVAPVFRPSMFLAPSTLLGRGFPAADAPGSERRRTAAAQRPLTTLVDVFVVVVHVAAHLERTVLQPVPR